MLVKILNNNLLINWFGSKIYYLQRIKVSAGCDRWLPLARYGIASRFQTMAGFKNRELYTRNCAQFKYGQGGVQKIRAPTINAFFEKLLLLKDKMNTKSGRNWLKKGHHICWFFGAILTRNEWMLMHWINLSSIGDLKSECEPRNSKNGFLKSR